MKAVPLTLGVALWLAFPVGLVRGQSSFLFRNHNPSYGIVAPVFDSQGVRLVGPDYMGELWGAATPDSLAPLVNIDLGNRREIVSFSADGRINSGTPFLCVSSVPPGNWAWLQMRAWDARLGQTYEEVVAQGVGGYGESPLFYAQGGNPFDQFPVPVPLIGLQSFSLRAVVPEPSTVALLLTACFILVIHRYWRPRLRFPSCRGSRSPCTRLR